MESLTEKQAAILVFIEERLDATGYPPTVREIALHFGYRSPKAAADHLHALERKGYLAREAGTARGLRVLTGHHHAEGYPAEPGGIPIVGDVAAGLPILAVENASGTLTLDGMFGGGDLFAVRVRGDSMVDYGIFEGDHVIVRRSPVLPGNVIAVVYLDGEATVKKIRKTDEGVELIPGNAKYPTLLVTPDREGFAVAGPVVGVVRAL